MFANVAEKAFVLIRADWPARQAGGLLEVLDAPDVIVQAVGSGKTHYYLLSRSVVAPALVESDDETPAYDALGLALLQSTPVVDAYDNELDPNAPDPAIIVEHGDVIGFCCWADSELDLSTLETKSFAGNRGAFDATVRYSVATRFPSKAVVGEIIPLTVYLTGDVVPGSLQREFDVGAQLCVRIEVVQRLEVVGPRKLSLCVQKEGGEPNLQFGLKATEVGLGVVLVYVSVSGQPVGSIELEVEAVGSAAEIGDGGAPDVKVDYPLLDTPVLIPDLCLTIAEDRIEGEIHLTFELKTREGYGGPKVTQSFKPVNLEKEPQARFHQFFQDLKGQPLSTVESFLEVRGSELYRDLVPEKLRSLLWSLRDRIYSLQLLSRDPWIPWELCRLQGWQDGDLRDGPFLCEAFAVTRWLPQLQSKPALKLRNVALVVPGDSKLKGAVPERDHLLSLQKDGGRNVTQIPATRLQVLQAMKSGEYDVWHFTGHGELDPNQVDRSVLRLEKGDTLEPCMLTPGEVQNLGKAQPLVFLNACQTGESISGLAGPAGWAERFLKAAWDREHEENGAAAFIGAYWPIRSESAYAFAQAFYDALLEENGAGPKTVGQAVLEARKAIKKEEDPTWLAYTVFAHPLATVQL